MSEKDVMTTELIAKKRGKIQVVHECFPKFDQKDYEMVNKIWSTPLPISFKIS